GRRLPAAQRVERAHSGAAHRPRPAGEQQRQVRSGRFSRLGAGDRRTPHAPATGARERGSAERSVSMKRLGRWLLVALALGGVGVTIGVPDTRKLSQYAATIEAVAGSDLQLRPLTGYSLTISQ